MLVMEVAGGVGSGRHENLFVLGACFLSPN